MNMTRLACALAVAALAPIAAFAQQPSPNMSFFITSVGTGNGGNLGGLEGADRHCQTLAEAVGAGTKTWHAYLSTSASGNTRAVEARSRIGTGPWYNARGVLIAENVDELHLDNNIRKNTALNEKGQVVNGRGDNPNEHDILTGAQPDGTAFGGNDDHTCSNWTSSGEGSAMLGHFDRQGGGFTSWNTAHPSRGCSLDNLRSTGGAGLLYCFAIN